MLCVSLSRCLPVADSTAIWPKCLLQCKQFCGFKLRIRRVNQPARHGLINNRNHINLKLISRINTDSTRYTRGGEGLGQSTHLALLENAF